MSDHTKCLLTIHKSFTGQYEDELTIEPRQIAQLIRKLDKFWYEVYMEDQVGKIPIDCCREMRDDLFQNLRIAPEIKQAVFVAKHDFINNCEDGDLKFARFEFIIGFHPINNDWWNGTRLNSVQRFNDNLFVNDTDCGIFPLTFVWKLRNDLLPDSIFDPRGIPVKVASKYPIIDNTVCVEKQEIQSNKTLPEQNKQTSSNTKKNEYLFYVKVVKTMEAKLDQEIDLPLIGEVLGIIEENDKLYYEGESLSRKIRGIFPKNFVVKIDNPENNAENSEPTGSNRISNADAICDIHHDSDNSSNGRSPVPPSFSPPPPPDILDILNYQNEKLHAKIESNKVDADKNSQQQPGCQDLPPSYEAAMNASAHSQPVAYGYANYMFNEMEPYGRALYDFEAQDDSELSLRQDQIVRLIRYYDQDWMEGEIHGRIGFFPRSYISIIVDCKEQNNSAHQSDQKQADSTQNHVEAIDFPSDSLAKILYDFDGEMEQDLKVRAGDIVTMLRRFTTTDWIEAKDSVGNVGFVHMNLCQPFQKSSDQSVITTLNATISTSNLYPKIDVLEKEKIAETSVSQQQEQVIQPKPHRRAPIAPRRSDVFPTFNQFLIQEKQEHYQFDLDGNESSIQSETNSNLKAQNQKQNQRECVITELLQTEKDYCHALNVCHHVFNSSIYEAKKVNVDVDRLLSDMKSIIDVSKHLIKSLENYAHNRAYVDQRVGICFLDLKFKINESYTQYCRNHDSVHSLLKFYEGNVISQSYIKNCLGRIQDQTNCFDLSSILIKPVQRILKYPLLLNELIKFTEEDHVDYEPLKMAFQMITDIATRINEHKRRQDLIQKYCRAKDATLAEKLKNLSMHSVLKKSSRFKYRILSSLQFSSGTKDKDYDNALHFFLEVDKTIRTFLKDMKDYIDAMDKYNVELLSTMETINEYCDFKSHPRFDIEQIREKYILMYHDHFKFFKKSIECNVIKPLTMLLEKFASPVRLISKRDDKRVDYEASLKSSKSSVENTNLLKNTFEALNQQLIDELPILSDTSLQILINCIQAFLCEHKRFVGYMAKHQLDLHELPLVKNTSFEFFSDIDDTFQVKHNLNFEQMLREFSLLHTSSFQESSSSLTAFTRLGSKRNSNTWKNSLPINKTYQFDTTQSQQIPQQKPGQSASNHQTQNESNRQILKNKYDSKHLYTVTKNYEPCDIMEICVHQNDLIGVIKYKEPNGNENRWYIDRGFIQGFVPRNLLTPYQTQMNSQKQWEQELNRYDQVAEDQISIPDPIEPERYYSTVPIDETFGSDHSSLLSLEEIDSNKKNELAEFDPLTSVSTSSTTFQNISSIISNEKQNEFENKKPDDNYYTAAYPFKAAGPNQISLNFGQKVLVLCKHDTSGNSDWWLVSHSNQKGYVPGNYLKK
nr:rho guanine nucleotide exchange factor 38-like isoform X3 [Dermatophagoides pteronyssinus]